MEKKCFRNCCSIYESWDTFFYLFLRSKNLNEHFFLNNQINSNGRYTKTFALLLYIWMLKKGKTWALKNRYKTLSTSRKIFRPVEKNDDKEKFSHGICCWVLICSKFLAHREMKFIFESYFFLHDFLLLLLRSRVYMECVISIFLCDYWWFLVS